MKKNHPFALFFIFALTVFPVMSQKVTVDLKRSKGSSLSFWRIVDENAKEVISENGHMNEDSVTFSLEADRLYSLRIIVGDTYIPVMLNYTLGINGENILRISEQSFTGEHEYKFFTGTCKPVSKITGGTNASISDFPWQVYYISGVYRCGASIIAPGWVLTAAHCTEDDNHIPIAAADMSIIAGTDTPSNYNSGYTYLISEVIIHENYTSAYAYDIALLRLKDPINNPNATPIKLISPVDVSDGATAPGVMSWVTGWGLTWVTPPLIATFLQKVQLPIVSNQQASVVWPSIPSTDLMAGYLNGNKDACNGDSGGPLVVPVTGEYKLAGIVSWGSSACNTYGAYTRVSDFISWISDKTGIMDFRPAVPYGNTVICSSADTTRYDVDPYPSGTNYEWKLYPDGTGTIISNSTNARVVWNQSYSGYVQVMVRTTVNNVVSDWSKLKVLVAPKITLLSASGDNTICANLPLTLSVDAEGYNLTYGWYRNNSLFQSGSSNIVSFHALDPANSGIYRCDISDACNTISSDNINITVLPLTSIKKLTPDIEVRFGNDTTLKVSSGGDNLSYQWQKDGTLIADAIDSSLVLYDVNTKDIGQYRVTVKGTCGTITSDSIYVFVKNKQAAGPVDVFVWPTVTTDEFHIAVNNDEAYTIQVYNSNGSFVKELKNCRYETSLYAGTLAAGNYILNISNANFRKIFKVIKI
jgi:secreted trypsin-like serine protease